jgi:acyl-CoA reductase-like NAD-dependent aldehyde dehydrogenase
MKPSLRPPCARRDAFPAWAATTQDAVPLCWRRWPTGCCPARAFAHLLTAEQGKPLDQAHAEVMGTVFTLKAFAEMRITDKVLVDEPGHRVIEHRTPLGVCAAMHGTSLLLANKLGPCLMAGNTMVAKPAPPRR